MSKHTKHWVTFYAPGSFTADTWTKDIEEGTQPRDIDWPDRAYAFEIKTRTDIHEGEKVYKGDTETIGPMYYHPESYLQTRSQVEQGSTLHRNMEANDWAKVVFTRWGNWPQPFNPGKTIIL